ncbi:hypothetical protein [Brevibacillus migulae]|uniref:hypothetical protein n=1 Tax=Brevibacillus migulae TaxID=1644114 RepID=UPI00106DD8C3|nr:hypothetical protein [Brevibacillus migulae]
MTDEAERKFDLWYYIAPALPSNAFTSTGILKDAPLIDETYVWYSSLDSNLSTAYFPANGHTAMGQTRPLEPVHDVEDIDVTELVGPVHNVKEIGKMYGIRIKCASFI